MVFEKTKPSTKPSKVAIDTTVGATLEDISTGKVVWALVKRHKFGLVSTWAVVVTVLYALPTLPLMVLDLFR